MLALSSLLKDRGLVTSDFLAEYETAASADRIDRYALNQEVIHEHDLLEFYAEEFQLEYIDLQNTEVDTDILKMFPAQELIQHKILPFQSTGGVIQAAVSDPFQQETINRLQVLSGRRLQIVLGRSAEITRLLKQHLGIGGGIVSQLTDSQSEGIEFLSTNSVDLDQADPKETASVMLVVNELLLDAIDHRASDIHIEPEEDHLEIRYRIDGVLHQQSTPAALKQLDKALISRVKIMADLNIAEKRLPQDGSIQVRVRGRDIDIRVSIIPMLHGEGVVLRILDKSRMVLDLNQLEFPESVNTAFDQLIHRPHGIILVTGPTGSGKTTTLYSALNSIRSTSTKIITVEDPIEYQLPGIRQIQVHPEIGLTFASSLRSILRHDPDVILVGEIRDRETAENAVQASLTGHLVLSTLHTNSAAGAFNRLIDMGVEPYLVSSTIEGVLAQRLIRQLCSCKLAPETISFPEDFPIEQYSPLNPVYQANGCRDCFQLGYRGRFPLFELISVDAELRQLCSKRVSTREILAHLQQQGFHTLRQHGWQRVLNGQTTIEEVLRVAVADEL